MRELLKLDFQRLFDGVLFKLALGICVVLGVWDLVRNVQAHYANIADPDDCIQLSIFYLQLMHCSRWTLSSFNIVVFTISTACDTAGGDFDGNGYQKRIYKKSESSKRAEKRDSVEVHLNFCGGVSAGNGGNFWSDDFQYDVPSNNFP